MVLQINLYHRIAVWLDAMRVRRRGDPEHHLIENFLSRGETALDVGANHGVYTYSMILCGAVVHAIEPNPALAKRLKGARLPRVVVHQAAAGATLGKAELFVPRGKRGRQDDPAGTLAHHNGVGDRFQVSIITIDSLDLDNLAFIKIDVEGYEEEVLKGGWNSIKIFRPYILIELEESIKLGCRKTIVNMLESLGYSAWYFDQGDWNLEANLPENQISLSGRFINNFIFNPDRLPPPLKYLPPR